MVMGMTYDQFWDGPYYLAAVYREAFMLRRKLENEQAWIQGAYFYDAISECMANAFDGKSGKKHKYIEHPFDIFPLTESEIKQRQAEENEKMRKVMEEMIRRRRREKQKG